MKMTIESQLTGIPALTIDTAPPAGLLCDYNFSKNLICPVHGPHSLPLDQNLTSGGRTDLWEGNQSYTPGQLVALYPS